MVKNNSKKTKMQIEQIEQILPKKTKNQKGP
jgi:hypothetical protein